MNIKTLCVSLLFFGSVIVCVQAQEPAAKQNQITVNVLGAVNKPSRYVLPAGATELDALASAGDIAQNGNRSQIRVIHPTTADKPDIAIINLKSVLSGLEKATVLRDGDTLVILDRKFEVAY